MGRRVTLGIRPYRFGRQPRLKWTFQLQRQTPCDKTGRGGWVGVMTRRWLCHSQAGKEKWRVEVRKDTACRQSLTFVPTSFSVAENNASREMQLVSGAVRGGRQWKTSAAGHIFNCQLQAEYFVVKSVAYDDRVAPFSLTCTRPLVTKQSTCRDYSRCNYPQCNIISI